MCVCVGGGGDSIKAWHFCHHYHHCYHPVMNVECPPPTRTTFPTRTPCQTTATRASSTASPTEAPTCPTTCPNTTCAYPAPNTVEMSTDATTVWWHGGRGSVGRVLLLLPQPSSTGRGAGGTVCRPSPAPCGCGHGVGVVLPQEDREEGKVRKGIAIIWRYCTVPSLYRASTGHPQTSRNPSYTPASISNTTPSFPRP